MLKSRTIVLAAALGVISVVSLSACSEKAETTSAEGAFSAVKSPTEVYTVHGVITALPIGEDPRASLRIHHEHIPTFKDKTGEVFMNDDGVPGMKAMEMPFPTLGPNVMLDDFAVGDKIEFDLSIAREPRTSFAITRIKKLPPDTAISFDNKTPPDTPHNSDEPLP